jgi:hypothetical protein
MSTVIRVGLMTLLVASCSTGVSPAVTRQTAQTSAAVARAETVGAANEPQAALHLKLAREEIAEAARFTAAGEDAHAQRALERADLDAELAVALTRESSLRARARQARAEIEQLQRSMP